MKYLYVLSFILSILAAFILAIVTIFSLGVLIENGKVFSLMTNYPILFFGTVIIMAIAISIMVVHVKVEEKYFNLK